jgi:hypothetical protein
VRRSILLALVAALALTVGLSSVAVAGQDGATASAKKGKGKGKGCKSKGKGKAKGKASASKKGKRKGKGCKGGAKTAPGWPLRGGEYEGQDGIGLKVTSGGKMAALVIAGAPCIPLPLELPEEPATSTAKSFKAGGETTALFGGYGAAKWSIEVTPQLKYKLTLDSSHALPEQTPCNSTGVRFSGTLEKAG